MRVLRELGALLRLGRFRRLFAVRIASQCADGLFQIGLATLFFFSPERQNSPAEVALAFAVLLAPFTLVGPWAGVFLDRWRRRQVLLYANIIRAAVTLAIAGLLLTAPTGQELGWPVYVLALVALSINRFLLSALSAGLPHVVSGPLLLTANALIPTLGAVAAGAGAGAGLVLGLVLPSGRPKDAAAVIAASLIMLGAAGLATRLGRGELGPDQGAASATLGRALAGIARELVAGARYLARRGTPGQALVIMAFQRFLFGVSVVASILIARNHLAEPGDTAAGLAAFGAIAGATAAGFALSIPLTPLVSPLLGPQRWIVACLVLGAVGQLPLVAGGITLATMLASGAIVGLAAQSAKIAVDTIVQRDTADAFRGRAFALYDVLYNSGFVAAAALGALILPDDGAALVVFAALGLAYLTAAIAFGLCGAREAREGAT